MARHRWHSWKYNNLVCNQFVSCPTHGGRLAIRFNTTVAMATGRVCWILANESRVAQPFLPTHTQTLERGREQTDQRTDHIVCMWCCVPLARRNTHKRKGKTPCDNEIPAKCRSVFFFLLCVPNNFSGGYDFSLQPPPTRFKRGKTWVDSPDKMGCG